MKQSLNKINKRNLFIGIFSFVFILASISTTIIFVNKENKVKVSVTDKPKNNLNLVDFSQAIKDANLSYLLVEVKKIGSNYENFFSSSKIKNNFFKIINQSYNYWNKKVINFNLYNKKVNYQISESNKRLDCELILTNKKNNKITYYSYINFLIL